jgi:hypothetical protein
MDVANIMFVLAYTLRQTERLLNGYSDFQISSRFSGLKKTRRTLGPIKSCKNVPAQKPTLRVVAKLENHFVGLRVKLATCTNPKKPFGNNMYVCFHVKPTYHKSCSKVIVSCIDSHKSRYPVCPSDLRLTFQMLCTIQSESLNDQFSSYYNLWKYGRWVFVVVGNT